MALSYNQPHSIPWDVKLGVHWLGLVKTQSIVSLYICNFNIQNLLLEKCLQSQTIYDYDSIQEEPLHNVCSQSTTEERAHTTVVPTVTDPGLSLKVLEHKLERTQWISVPFTL